MVVVVVAVVPQSTYCSIYTSSTRIILVFMVPDVSCFSPDVFGVLLRKRGPAAYMGGFGEARKS